jgi:hypothetical protein
MVDLFLILSFICLLMFLLGVINPKWALLWGKEKTRKKVGIYFGILFFVFLSLLAISIPNNEQENKTATIENINAINTENNEYSEKAVFSSDMTEDEFFSLLKKDDLYNECIEISDRVSEYKRNKKWIIETTEYLLEKCDKWDERAGSSLTNLLSDLRANRYNYTDERHKIYEAWFKGIGGGLISDIYATILRENLYKFSVFLPINKDSLLDLIAQNQFCYIKDQRGEEGWGNYIEKIYSQSEAFNSPYFSVGWDKISGKLVSITIPLGGNFEWDKRDQKGYYYKIFNSAFAKPYDYSMQVIEIFDDDLKNYLYKQIENFRNYNQLKFEESSEGEDKIFTFSKTLTFNGYSIGVIFFAGDTSMIIWTTELDGISKHYGDLSIKYMENQMGLK